MRDVTVVGASASANLAMLREVRRGLAAAQKELPAKYFYDSRGSALFEEITRLPEYYLTRTERALLEVHVPAWMAALGTRSVVELGAGSASKTRVILDAMDARRAGAIYVPVDVSAEFVGDVAHRLRDEYPELAVRPAIADISRELSLPGDLPRPMLVAFLGSTIGNFTAEGATALLERIRRTMRVGDRLLLGVDLRKDVAILEAAYNDRRGVTAEFNRNMLRVINRALGADFDVTAFRHRAFFDDERSRIEMHLVPEGDQEVRIPGMGPVTIRDGESIRTEISCKYDEPRVRAMLAAAGLRLLEWRTDPAALYAILLAAP